MQHCSVDEHSAAVLMGIPLAELRRLARLAALGRHGGETADGATSSALVFSYDDLRRIAILALRPGD